MPSGDARSLDGSTAGEAGPDRVLGGQHAADHEDHRDEVDRAEALTEE